MGSIDYGEYIYKIGKTNGSYKLTSRYNTYSPNGTEEIGRFPVNNDVLAEKYLKSILHKFHYRNEFYRCPKEWLEIACLYVQRRINQDEDIMDLDLPWENFC